MKNVCVILSVILAAIYLAPTLYSVGLSLDILTVPRSSQSPTLQWYASMLSDPRLRSAVQRSFGVAALVSVLSVAIAFFALERFRYHPSGLRRLILFLIWLPLFVPETTHALTLSDLFSALEIPKGWWAVLTGELVFVIPFVGTVVLLRLAGLPPELLNAADDLGLTRFEEFRLVTGPLIWPTLAFACFFAFVLSFNEYARTTYLEARELYAVFLKGNLSSGGNQAVYAVSSTMFSVGLAFLALLSLQYPRGRKAD